MKTGIVFSKLSHLRVSKLHYKIDRNKKALELFVQGLQIVNFIYLKIVCVRSGPTETNLIGTFNSASR